MPSSCLRPPRRTRNPPAGSITADRRGVVRHRPRRELPVRVAPRVRGVGEVPHRLSQRLDGADQRVLLGRGGRDEVERVPVAIERAEPVDGALVGSAGDDPRGQVQHPDARRRGIRVLTHEELIHGDVSLKYVSRLMHRNFPDTVMFRRTLQCIWHQVNAGQEIYVVGKQWMWKVQHPQGRRELNELHVPRGRPVKLWMTSEDVIHSFYIPAFRIKMDVLPGRYTTQWFEAVRPGRYHLLCAEYCGTDHAVMGGFVEVMEPADYERWLAGGAAAGEVGASLADGGQLLYTKMGCASCHGARGEGSPSGPDLHDLFGKQVRLDSQAVVVADETYVRESLLEPQAKLVAGYPPLMPSFKGQLREDDILRLVAYLKTLRNPSGTAAQPGGSP